jgi:hypothetical protein
MDLGRVLDFLLNLPAMGFWSAPVRETLLQNLRADAESFLCNDWAVATPPVSSNKIPIRLPYRGGDMEIFTMNVL